MSGGGRRPGWIARATPLGLAFAIVGILLIPTAAAVPAGASGSGAAVPRVSVPPSSVRSSGPGSVTRHWVGVNTSSVEVPPSGGAVTYDPQLGGLVLFGGYSVGAVNGGYLNSTWVFRSDRWTELCSGFVFNTSCPTAPPARESEQMGYDSTAQELLMFGGIGEPNPIYSTFEDTWALRNSTWVLLQSTFTAGPVTAPYNGTLVNDPAGGFVYLDLPDQPAGDTAFEFQNDSWSHAPPVPSSYDVVYFDPTTGRLDASSPLGPAAAFVLGPHGWVATGRVTSPVANRSAELLGSSYDPASAEELAYVGLYNVSGANWTFASETLAQTQGNWTDIDPEIQGGSPFGPLDFDADENYTSVVAFSFDPIIDATVLLLENVSTADYSSAASQSTWALTEPLTVNLTPSVAQTDAGLPVDWAIMPTGGFGVIGVSFATNTLAGCSGGAPSDWLNCTYSAPGTYSVRGFVTDGAGDSANASATVVVHADPQALGTSTEAATTVGATVDFVGRWANGTAPITGTWSFGDGSEVAMSDPSHTYTTAGTYTATWSVRDAVGATSVRLVAIVVNPELAVDASVARVITDAGVPDRFSTAIVGGTYPDQVRWSFGNGAISGAPNASYAYPETGGYMATVEVTDYVGVTADSRVYVEVEPAMVIAAGANLTSAVAGSPVLLAAGAVGGTAPFSYFWELGDGGWATSQRFVHTYESPGIYLVSVVVNDSAGGSQESQFDVVVASAPSAPPPTPGPSANGTGAPPPAVTPPSVFPRLTQQAGSTGPVPVGDAVLLAGIAAVLVVAAGSTIDRIRLARGPSPRGTARRAKSRQDDGTRGPRTPP